jgi:hypothetical protein
VRLQRGLADEVDGLGRGKTGSFLFPVMPPPMSVIGPGAGAFTVGLATARGGMRTVTSEPAVSFRVTFPVGGLSVPPAGVCPKT